MTSRFLGRQLKWHGQNARKAGKRYAAKCIYPLAALRILGIRGKIMRQVHLIIGGLGTYKIKSSIVPMNPLYPPTSIYSHQDRVLHIQAAHLYVSASNAHWEPGVVCNPSSATLQSIHR